LFACHLFLLGIAFTAVAAVASHTGQSSLQGLLDFYLAHRLLAIVSSVMLVYCPPLLDILRRTSFSCLQLQQRWLSGNAGAGDSF
jgi:hypothetical protein